MVLSTSQVPPSKTKIVVPALSHSVDHIIKSAMYMMEMRKLQKKVWSNGKS